jgi:cephalosporin-C deacetylase-like acetyl esterase
MFAVYHHLGAADHQIAVYPFADHDGGGDLHADEQYRFVRRYLGEPGESRLEA